MEYSTIFFDLDDTLLDTLNNTKNTLEEVFIAFELKHYFPSFDVFYREYFKPNNISMWEKYNKGEIDKATLTRERFLGPLRPIKEISKDFALSINDEYLKRIVSKKALKEGAIEILEYLKPKYKMHIISNGFTELQYDKMNTAGLQSYFDRVILSDKVGINKPDRAIFEYALREANVSTNDVIMIGDSFSSDISGAQNCNIDQIWYNPHNEKGTDTPPTYMIKHLEEIKGIL